MPYRTSAYAGPCVVCGELTPHRCRRCGQPICAAHAESFEFYVPTMQCADEELCEPFERPYEKRKPYELGDMFEYGRALSDLFGQ